MPNGRITIVKLQFVAGIWKPFAAKIEYTRQTQGYLYKKDSKIIKVSALENYYVFRGHPQCWPAELLALPEKSSKEEAQVKLITIVHDFKLQKLELISEPTKRKQNELIANQ